MVDSFHSTRFASLTGTPKAHKCVEIAKRQMAAGACGVCVATVQEAELMAGAGIPGLLLTSPVADPLKIRRIVATGAMVAADHVRQVAWYEEAAAGVGVQVDVLVDLDVGDHRTGAASLGQALDIGLAIGRAGHLTLRGVQAYSVAGAHGRDVEERRRICAGCFKLAAAVRDALGGGIISGGSTGTWDVDLAIPEVSELQAGSYPLMDLAYRRLGIDFPNAMTVLATVISANHEAFVTVDAGFKAMATDRPFGPEVAGMPGAVYRWGGDEFGYIDVKEPPALGSRIELIPPHCDPTVNLYDRIYACRGGRVEEVWAVKSATLG